MHIWAAREAAVQDAASRDHEVVTFKRLGENAWYAYAALCENCGGKTIIRHEGHGNWAVESDSIMQSRCRRNLHVVPPNIELDNVKLDHTNG